MGAGFDDGAAVEDNDRVSIADSGQTVSNDDGGPAGGDCVYGLLDDGF